jgi:hypothetical protein
MSGFDSGSAAANGALTALASQDAQNAQAKKNDGGGATAADILDGVSGAADLTELGVNACQAVAKAMQPAHVTGGRELPTSFTTGGGDGAANGFQTVADCAPDADAAAGVVDIASGIGEAVIDGIGTVLGGIFEGLGSL